MQTNKFWKNVRSCSGRLKSTIPISCENRVVISPVEVRLKYAIGAAMRVLRAVLWREIPELRAIKLKQNQVNSAEASRPAT